MRPLASSVISPPLLSSQPPPSPLPSFPLPPPTPPPPFPQPSLPQISPSTSRPPPPLSLSLPLPVMWDRGGAFTTLIKGDSVSIPIERSWPSETTSPSTPSSPHTLFPTAAQTVPVLPLTVPKKLQYQQTSAEVLTCE